MNEIIGIDIGGTHFRIGRVNNEGNVSDFRRVLTREVLTSGDVLRDIASFIASYAENEKYDAVCIGFPATLNRERTRILQAPNLPFMENLPVVDYLQAALNVPVYAERDVVMTMCYDIQKYNLPVNSGIICGIYFGTGIGNAIMIDGVNLTGRNGTAGELGHVPVDGSEILCGCGNTGCVENLAGGKYLAYLRENFYARTDISEIFVKHAEDCRLREFVSRMALCAAAEINILDPDFVIIGGGVVNMKNFPVKELDAKILEHVRKPYPAENLRVIYAEDEPEKSIVGAGYYAYDKIMHSS